MKKTNVLIFALVIITGCASQSDFLMLSKRFYQLEQRSKRPFLHSVIQREKKIRDSVFKNNKIKFLEGSVNDDTLFVVQCFDAETWKYFGDIWNRKKRLTYEYLDKQLKYDSQPALTNYQYKLITAWDTLNIRKMEKEAGFIDNHRLFKAMRCYKDNSKWKTDTIFFKDFYDRKNR